MAKTLQALETLKVAQDFINSNGQAKAQEDLYTIPVVEVEVRSLAAIKADNHKSEIRRGLDAISAGDPCTFQLAFLNKGKTSKSYLTYGYFNDLDALTEIAYKQTVSKDVQAVYVNLQDIHPDCIARAENKILASAKAVSAGDVIGYRHFLVDVDRNGIKDISSSDIEKEQIRQVLEEIREYLVGGLGWPDPAFIGDSGNGYHQGWAVSLPANKETQALYKQCYQALQQKFGSDVISIDASLADPNQLIKLYGTATRKGDHTKERPWRWSQLLTTYDTEVVSVEQLQALAARYKPTQKAPGTTTSSTQAARSDLWWIAHTPEAVEEWANDAGITLGDRTDDRNGFKWRVDCLTSDAHKDGAAIILNGNGYLKYKCHHASCSSKTVSDLLALHPAPIKRKEKAQTAEDSVTFVTLMDEIKALDAASPTGQVDKSDLMKYLLNNAERYDKLLAFDGAMLRVELQQRKITKTWIDTTWAAVKNAARKVTEAEKSTAAELPQMLKTWPYDVQRGCIGNWRVFTNDETGEEKEVFSPLCNFDVRIVADVAADDGEETSRKIAIAGTLDTGLPLPEIEIEADEFEPMKWPVAKWGSRVSIEPFKGAASLLRHAIQKLSADTMTDRRTFTHTGWRVINGQRVFLDADGAIGVEGVSVKLPQNLKNYVFPRDNAISAKDAMRASVDLLDIAPAKVSSPLYAATWAAPLSEITPSVFTPSLNGGSGSLKSSLSAVHLNHFGAKFNEYAMPADWLATANSLEKLTFHAKDIPLIIDDFRPSTNPAESRMLQEAVSRITRAVGNRQGRSRLDSNSEFKRTYAPRGVVIMTAEHNATGKSTTSRILTIDVEPGDINSSLLTVAQKQRHVYSYAMRGYIESIAKDYDELAKILPAKVADLRTRNNNGHHKRLPNATAILYVAFECAMSYAVEVEAITKEEAKQRCDDCYEALKSIEQIQSEATEAEDPAIKYITILASLIAQNKAHLVGKGKNLSNLGMSLSEKLGWYDADNVYLLPGAYNAVCRYATVEGWSFPSDENTLRKELDRQQWLTKHEPNRHTTAARPPGATSIERVTVIDRAKFALVLLDMGVEFPPPVKP